MVEFYRSLAEAYGRLGIAAKALIIVGIFVLTSAFGVALIVWLPADHFSRAPEPTSWWRRHPVVRIAGLVFKNLLGVLVLPLGIVMSLPLVPGPGLILVLVGLSLLDFPGKRKLERRLLARPGVRSFLSDVRQRFGKAPFSDPLPTRSVE